MNRSLVPFWCWAIPHQSIYLFPLSQLRSYYTKSHVNYATQSQKRDCFKFLSTLNNNTSHVKIQFRSLGCHAPQQLDSHSSPAHHDHHEHDSHHDHHAPSDYVDRTDVERRVLECLSRVDKINHSKLSLDATFESHGLDSLDMVEVVIQIEEEFFIDIYDEDAIDFLTVKQVVDYISDFPFAMRDGSGH